MEVTLEVKYKELLIDFIEYAKSRHVIPILHSNIEPLVDDYLSEKLWESDVVESEVCIHRMQDRVRTHRGAHCNNCGKRF